MRVFHAISRILQLLTILSFSGLIIVVMIQIIGRYTPLSFVWTEELSRFLFIFAISFGAPIAMERREYVRVDILINLIPERIRKIYDAFVYLILGVFSGTMIYYAYQFVLLGRNQSSATLMVKMSYIYASMVMTFVLIAIFSLVNIYQILVNDKVEGGVTQ